MGGYLVLTLMLIAMAGVLLAKRRRSRSGTRVGPRRRSLAYWRRGDDRLGQSGKR